MATTSRIARDQLVSFETGRVHLILTADTLRRAVKGQQRRFQRTAAPQPKPHVMYDDGLYGSYGI